MFCIAFEIVITVILVLDFHCHGQRIANLQKETECVKKLAIKFNIRGRKHYGQLKMNIVIFVFLVFWIILPFDSEFMNGTTTINHM